ncbi:MAG TPA: TRAP transporter small permease [Longimicrobiaceae bacterium]|nr:TRAP transporter small permease [Longimicrobiaceae bacterium]
MERPGGVMRLKAAVDRLLGGVLAAFMGALVLDVLWQVFTRFVLRDPSSFTDELARYLLIWVALLGGAYTAGQRMHLAIDLLPSSLHGRRRHAVGALIESAVLLFAVAVMVVGGARLVGLTLLLGQTSAALRIPLGWVYTVLPLSGALIAFYSLVFLGEHLRGLRGDPTASVPEPAPGEGLAPAATEVA